MVRSLLIYSNAKTAMRKSHVVTGNWMLGFDDTLVNNTNER